MSELGTKLRDARIQKGYTLNTLQQMTKIQKKYLVAIEEGNFDEMPGNFYARAFVKQYADMVGLNGDELLETYQQELDIHPRDTELIELEEEEELPSRAATRGSNNERNTVELIISYLPLILLVAIIVMIMISLVIAISNIGRSEQNQQVSQSSIENTVVSSVEPESVSMESIESEPEESSIEELGENDLQVGQEVITLVSNEGEAVVYELNAPFSEYEFGVDAVGYVWVGAFEDDSMVVDTTIPEGDTFEYTVSPGVEEFRMTLGYPEGGIFTVNGVDIEIDDILLADEITFVLADDVEETEELDETDTTDTFDSESDALEEENAETTETSTGNYQGPAVLDPEFNSEEVE